MSYARDVANFGLSPPLTLGRDNTGSKNPPQSGILFYPIYATSDAPPSSVAERQQQLRGYVYVAFRIKEMMLKRNEILDRRGISYTLTDVTEKPSQYLYSYTSPSKSSASTGSVTMDLPIMSRTWRLTMTIPEPAASKPFGPTILFVAGLVGSALLGLFVFMLLRWRIGYVKNEYEKDIENTKDELLALASHQLRTPATGVKQYLGMLLEGMFGDIEEEQRTLISRAYKANDMQLEIIDQLLYVAKADAGQLIVRRDKIELKSVLTSIADSLRGTAAQKNITLRLLMPKKVTVKADERLVRMIFENLLSNAIKYSYPSKTVTVRLREQDHNAVIRIKDQGVGIDAADHPRLFQKFTRVNNELSSEVEGSGLGLYLAAKLAEAHGGSIVVDSKLKVGSTFTVRLPLSGAAHSVVQLTENKRTKK